MAIVKSTAIGKASGKIGSVTYAYYNKKLIARAATSETPAGGWTGTQTEWRTLWGHIQAFVSIIAADIGIQVFEPESNYLRTTFVSDNFNTLMLATQDFIVERTAYPTGEWPAVAWYYISLHISPDKPLRLRRGVYRQTITMQPILGVQNIVFSNMNKLCLPAILLRMNVYTYVIGTGAKKIEHWYKEYHSATLQDAYAAEGAQHKVPVPHDVTSWNLAIVIPIAFVLPGQPSASFMLTEIRS